MAMKVQTYTQLIQNVQGGVQDLVEVSDMVLKAIATDFQLASKLIEVFESVSKDVALKLDLINLATSIAQVVQAKNAYEQGMAITNLVGAVVPLSMTIISLASAALGAVAVADFINPLTIPLAGLLIGGSALVSIELKDKAAYQYATDLFKHLLDDYNKSKDVEWSEIVNSTLVIQSVNLLDGVIELGKATATEATW
ncbi:TcdA/TcdB pore-forming domain-containing protein, partial [Klebsiella quasivariicola]|uniref:TcdA/TcdB pore-forming domain-containing protein n=2 Tax=Gammaproteobacteria TaxID=1236 RepID=UPI002B054F75